MTRDEAAVSFAKVREADRVVRVSCANADAGPDLSQLATVYRTPVQFTAPVEGTTRYTGMPGTFTCYKVVCRHEPDERSWCSLAAHGAARVVYRVGEPAQAPAWLAVHGYHLTAFQTLAQAARYRHGMELAVICAVFECEGFYREPLAPMAAPCTIGTRQASVTPCDASYQGWPEGTVMAQRLTLLRRVPEEALRGV